MNKTFSGKQVNRAGEHLVSSDVDNNSERFSAAMEVLSYWRFSHEIPLEEAFDVLQQITRKKDKLAIFAKRLKRHKSIVSKLKRFDGMALKNMQDIGGCRAVVSNKKKLVQVVRELRQRKEFTNPEGKIRAKDYVEKPKPDGYRGYHLIGQFNDVDGKSRSIELQIRTRLQHDWATALEIVDLFTGQALKSNQGSQDWKEFFASVSAEFATMDDIHLFNTLDDQIKLAAYSKKVNGDKGILESRKKTYSIARKLEVVKNFEAYANGIKVADGRLEEQFVDGYVLLEVNTTQSTVTSTIFTKEENQIAENKYIEAEKKAAEQKELVVALVSTTAVGGIREAYPNYFANSTDFLKHLRIILDPSVVKKSGIFSGLFN